MKKILIIGIILSLFLFGGCTIERKNFCKSVGYKEFAYVNKGDTSTEFFCYKAVDKEIEVSRIYYDMESAKMGLYLTDCCGECK